MKHMFHLDRPIRFQSPRLLITCRAARRTSYLQFYFTCTGTVSIVCYWLSSRRNTKVGLKNEIKVRTTVDRLRNRTRRINATEKRMQAKQSLSIMQDSHKSAIPCGVTNLEGNPKQSPNHVKTRAFYECTSG